MNKLKWQTGGGYEVRDAQLRPICIARSRDLARQIVKDHNRASILADPSIDEDDLYAALEALWEISGEAHISLMSVKNMRQMVDFRDARMAAEKVLARVHDHKLARKLLTSRPER